MPRNGGNNAYNHQRQIDWRLYPPYFPDSTIGPFEFNEQQLADNIMRFLADCMQAQVGTLYLIDAGSGRPAPDLKLVGSYAFSQRGELNARIDIGEGLVGQAAYEKKSISVTQLPDGYTRIHSSVGAAIPRFAVVVPFLYESETLGVVELAAFEEFSTLKNDFLTLIMESIALGFAAARSRQNTHVLLEESQRQGEQLKTQQEELRQSNEELEEQAQMLRASEEELKQQHEELMASNEELEEKGCIRVSQRNIGVSKALNCQQC